MFAINPRNDSTTQAGGNGTASWNGTTVGDLISGTDSYDDYFSVSSDKITITFTKPGIYKAKACVHISQTTSARLGVGWFNGDTEMSSFFAYQTANSACSASTELILNVESNYSIVPKIFAESKNYTKFLGGHLTNFTIEYLGELK